MTFNSQYINPELYQLKKYNPKSNFNNRRGGNSMGRKPYGQGSGGFKKNTYGQGNKTGGYGSRTSNYDNGGYKKPYESNGGYNNGASGSKYGGERKPGHTRFDAPASTPYAAAHGIGTRFQ